MRNCSQNLGFPFTLAALCLFSFACTQSPTSLPQLQEDTSGASEEQFELHPQQGSQHAPAQQQMPSQQPAPRPAAAHARPQAPAPASQAPGAAIPEPTPTTLKTDDGATSQIESA